MRYISTRFEDNGDGSVTVTTDFNGEIHTSVMVMSFDEIVDATFGVATELNEKNVFDNETIIGIPNDAEGI